MSHENDTSHLLSLRRLTPADYPDVKRIMDEVFAGMGGSWSRDEFLSQVGRFPDGQICIEDQGRVVAGALALIIDYDEYKKSHTYEDIVGKGHLNKHDPEGDCLYGIDIFVDPEYQGMRLGRRLYDARKKLCEETNLRGILIGGRMPGYVNHASRYSPQEYIRLVKSKELYDPVLSFQLSNDFHIKRLLKNYNPEDRASRSHAILLEWDNIFYEERKKLFSGYKTHVRLGVVQWQMRLFSSFEEFIQQVEFFIDTVSDYEADLILFPELFNAPLMAGLNQDNPAEAIRALAEYTDPLRESLTELAVHYNINIVTGSVPEYRDHRLYNVSFLCRRNGTQDAQYKLHITPDEYAYWGVQGGEGLRVFETDIGKIGILICYDVEFPELARYLADEGALLLLVPFWTDTKNSYLRVRRCAQARAIENECYVAIAGSVGNLPKVENMDIRYAQSAIFTPSDFAFPHDAVAAEATPNTETTLIVDLDMDQLKQLRRKGSVRNLESRRKDLYRIVWNGSR